MQCQTVDCHRKQQGDGTDRRGLYTPVSSSTARRSVAAISKWTSYNVVQHVALTIDMGGARRYHLNMPYRYAAIAAVSKRGVPQARLPNKLQF